MLGLWEKHSIYGSWWAAGNIFRDYTSRAVGSAGRGACSAQSMYGPAVNSFCHTWYSSNNLRTWTVVRISTRLLMDSSPSIPRTLSYHLLAFQLSFVSTPTLTLTSNTMWELVMVAHFSPASVGCSTYFRNQEGAMSQMVLGSCRFHFTSTIFYHFGRGPRMIAQFLPMLCHPSILFLVNNNSCMMLDTHALLGIQHHIKE